MKTRQDQIDEMTKLIQAEYEQWLDTMGVIPKASTYYAECMGCAIDSAETLYNLGFGNVDEYKAEIERLKVENDKYAELFKMKDKDFFTITVEDWGKFKSGVLAQIKQAKIDVLNELKERAWQGYDVGMYIVNTQQIDELIKEVQNDSL